MRSCGVHRGFSCSRFETVDGAALKRAGWRCNGWWSLHRLEAQAGKATRAGEGSARL
jgi:hypothetical protein